MSISYSELSLSQVSFDLELVIMSQVWLCLLLVVTLSLQIPGVNLKASGKDIQEKPTSNEDSGTNLHDTIKQSSCKPRETLVKVHDEFPELVQFHFRPDCVSVKRCSGCCPDEATTCMPEPDSTHKVEFEVLRSNAKGPPRIRLAFVAHAKCTCRYKESN